MFMNYLGEVRSVLWVVGLVLGLAAGEVRGAAVFPSENGEYSVELTQGDTVTEVVVSVSRVDQGRATLLWSRRTEWPNPYGFPNWILGRVEGLVSNNGKTAILRDGHTFSGLESSRGGMTALREDGESRVSMADVEALLRLDEVPERYFFTLSHAQTGPALMDFMWASKGWYCAFHPQAKEWLVIGLEDLKARRAEVEERKLLDVEGRRRALKLVEEHQPGLVKTLFNEFRSKVASYVPAFSSPPHPMSAWTRVASAYELLAAQRHPEDKVWLEKLLKGVGEDLSMSNGYYGPQSTTFLLHSYQRALADGLLSEWDGIKTDEMWVEFAPWETYGRLNFLGAVAGEVRLPVPTSTNSGNLVVCLIPAEFKAGEWENRTSVIRMNGDLNGGFRGPGAGRPIGVGVGTTGFIFSTIPPGEYRLKAVWDKRPPHEAGTKGASPGDYESAETTAFTVTAGAVLTGAVLECTNRVGEAAAFYAEDATWKKQVTGQALLAETTLLRERLEQSTRKILFEAPLSKWLLGKELGSRSKVRVAKIALVEGNEDEGEGPEVLQVSFWNDGDPNLAAELTDEHGCKLPGRRVDSNNRSSAGVTQVRFAVFPRAGEFKLEVSSIYGEKKLGGWRLTNAAPVRVDRFEPESLPVRREVEDAVVELQEIHRISGGKVGLAQGEEKWEITEEEYLDEMGNRARRLSSMCRVLERVKVRVTLQPELRQVFPADQKWTVEMRGYPERGEYRNLGMSQEVQGVKFKLLAITGQGEFTYEGGGIIEAQAEYDRYAPRMNWSGNNGSVFVKMDPNEAFGFSTARKHTVVSRVPHVGLEVEGLKLGQMWALLEERIPIHHEPREAGEQPMRYYLPINRPKLEETERLTFVVFERRSVEFVAALPEDGEPKSRE